MKILINIFLALTLSLLVGPLAVFLAKKIGAIDVPESASHKKHNTPTPLAGGVVLLIVFPTLFFLSGLEQERSFNFLLVGGVIVFFFGGLDDIYGLSAPQKFLGQFSAAILLASSGTTIRFLETANLPLEVSTIIALNWGLTLFWVVGITNAFNLIDSMDGLVAGLTFIITSFFTVIIVLAEQTMLAQLSAILVGVSLGLYFYNKPPARFFLGDSGSQVLGFFLASIAIIYRPPDLNPGSTWFVPVLLLGVPIFDTGLVIISRLRRRKPLFRADRAHTYHRLVQRGFGSKQAVFLIHSSALILSFIAFLAMFLPPKNATFLFLLVLLLGILLIFFFETFMKIEE